MAYSTPLEEALALHRRVAESNNRLQHVLEQQESPVIIPSAMLMLACIASMGDQGVAKLKHIPYFGTNRSYGMRQLRDAGLVEVVGGGDRRTRRVRATRLGQEWARVVETVLSAGG